MIDLSPDVETFQKIRDNLAAEYAKLASAAAEAIGQISIEMRTTFGPDYGSLQAIKEELLAQHLAAKAGMFPSITAAWLHDSDGKGFPSGQA